VLSGLWFIFVPAAYFIGIATYPSPVATAFRKFYTWIPGKPAGPGEPGHEFGFIPDIPLADGFKLSLLCILPVLIGLLALFVSPRSIRWVRDGFHHDKRNAA
jgi:hypothetical protein